MFVGCFLVVGHLSFMLVKKKTKEKSLRENVVSQKAART